MTQSFIACRGLLLSPGKDWLFSLVSPVRSRYFSAAPRRPWINPCARFEGDIQPFPLRGRDRPPEKNDEMGHKCEREGVLRDGCHLAAIVIMTAGKWEIRGRQYIVREALWGCSLGRWKGRQAFNLCCQSIRLRSLYDSKLMSFTISQYLISFLCG